MSYDPGASGISGAPDVAFGTKSDGQVVTYDQALDKWRNLSPTSGAVTYADVPAGSTFTVYKPSAGSWPGSRPSARTDIYFIFKGSGTAGTASSPESIMIDGDDWQILP